MENWAFADVLTIYFSGFHLVFSGKLGICGLMTFKNPVLLLHIENMVTLLPVLWNARTQCSMRML